jgi:hypothetical protein
MSRPNIAVFRLQFSQTDTKMTDEPNEPQNENAERTPIKPHGSPKPGREVVVTHLDSPPPTGKQSIHPRRPAPLVPTREQRRDQ